MTQVKSVLHTSYVPEEEEPLGRFEQTEVLRECISSSIGSRSGACIYVSGLPGTGNDWLNSLHQEIDPIAAICLLCLMRMSASATGRRTAVASKDLSQAEVVL